MQETDESFLISPIHISDLVSRIIAKLQKMTYHWELIQPAKPWNKYKSITFGRFQPVQKTV